MWLVSGCEVPLAVVRLGPRTTETKIAVARASAGLRVAVERKGSSVLMLALAPLSSATGEAYAAARRSRTLADRSTATLADDRTGPLGVAILASRQRSAVSLRCAITLSGARRAAVGSISRCS